MSLHIYILLARTGLGLGGVSAECQRSSFRVSTVLRPRLGRAPVDTRTDSATCVRARPGSHRYSLGGRSDSGRYSAGTRWRWVSGEVIKISPSCHRGHRSPADTRPHPHRAVKEMATSFEFSDENKSDLFSSEHHPEAIPSIGARPGLQRGPAEMAKFQPARYSGGPLWGL